MTAARSTNLIDRASALLVFALAACTPVLREPGVAKGHELASMTVTSKDFSQSGRIPIDQSCDGRDRLPDLTWSAPPEGTRSIVIVIDDPDAPNGTFTHMLLYNIGAEIHRLGADKPIEGARFGTNDMGAVHYSGPCPPRGEAHRYRFRVIAVDVPLDVREGLTRAEVDTAMDGHLLGEGALTGIFGH